MSCNQDCLQGRACTCSVPAKAAPRAIPIPKDHYVPKLVVPSRQGAMDALKILSRGLKC